MSRSRYTLFINSFIDSLIKKKFRVYLERAHPAFLTTLVVLVLTTYDVLGLTTEIIALKIQIQE